MHLKTYITIWCFRVNMSGQLDQNFHLHDWWRNFCTYGPGSVLVLVNEALEPLEKAKPRRFTIIKSLLRGTHQDLLLDQVSKKRNSWWCMTYLWGGWKRLLIACSYTYDGATEAQDTVPLLWSTLDVLTYLKSNDKYCLNFSNKFNAHVYWQIMINVIFKVLLPHWEEKHCRLTKSCTGNWSLETTGEPPNGTASQER